MMIGCAAEQELIERQQQPGGARTKPTAAQQPGGARWKPTAAQSVCARVVFTAG